MSDLHEAFERAKEKEKEELGLIFIENRIVFETKPTENEKLLWLESNQI